MSQIGTKVSIGLRIKYRYSCPILMERDFLGQIFEKKKPSSDTKFHENPSCGSRVVPCGKTGRQT